jgi:uncharacterized protein YjiS (DUF1127 family)
MSVLSIRSYQRQRTTASTIYGLLETIERWWVAYLTWQLQRAAIAHLALLSDRELKDIELHRSQPPAAVPDDANSVRMSDHHD